MLSTCFICYWTLVQKNDPNKNNPLLMKVRDFSINQNSLQLHRLLYSSLFFSLIVFIVLYMLLPFVAYREIKFLKRITNKPILSASEDLALELEIPYMLTSRCDQSEKLGPQSP